MSTPAILSAVFAGFSQEAAEELCKEFGPEVLDLLVRAYKEHGLTRAAIEEFLSGLKCVAVEMEPVVARAALELLVGGLDHCGPHSECACPEISLEHLDPKTIGRVAALLTARYGDGACAGLANLIETHGKGNATLRHALVFALRHYGSHFVKYVSEILG